MLIALVWIGTVWCFLSNQTIVKCIFQCAAVMAVVQKILSPIMPKQLSQVYSDSFFFFFQFISSVLRYWASVLQSICYVNVQHGKPQSSAQQHADMAAQTCPLSHPGCAMNQLKCRTWQIMEEVNQQATQGSQNELHKPQMLLGVTCRLTAMLVRQETEMCSQSNTLHFQAK